MAVDSMLGDSMLDDSMAEGTPGRASRSRYAAVSCPR